MDDKLNTEQPTPDDTKRSAFETFLMHQRRALEETGKALEALLPEGFRVHGSNASKEFTQGFKVLVNAAMQELRKARKATTSEPQPTESTTDEQPPSTTGKTKVRVKLD